ncbi:MAG: hypothetical protein JNL21_27670 [Myxococcales bacterium]|nr:hypothetical protein [Myxococcales bacterium]
MANRPAGDPIVWARESTYPDGPHAGTPTKTRAPQAVIDRGAYVDRKMPAPWLNDAFHDVTGRVAYLDLFDLLNFDAPDASLVSESVSLATDTCVTWDPKARVFWLVEGTTGLRVFYSADGRTWAEDSSLAGTPAEGESIACEPRSGIVLACERTTGNAHKKDTTNTWSEHNALMSNMVVRGVVPQPYAATEGLFLVFGQDSSNNRPKLYTATTVGTPAATKRDLQNESSISTSIRWIGVAPDRVACMGTDGRAWYHVGFGDGTWLQANGGEEILENAVGMSYDEVNDVFWAIDNDGTMKTSKDGVSWVEPDYGGTFEFEVAGGCLSFNGVWICRGQITNPPAASLAGPRVLFSTNMGLTWQDVGCPVNWLTLCSEAGRKLLAIATDGTTSRTKRTR